MKQFEALDARYARLRTSHDALLTAVKDLAAIFAARPDIAHLLGPAEVAAYDKARATIAAVEELAP